MEISDSIAHLIILQNDKVLWNKVPTWSDIAGVAAKHVVLLQSQGRKDMEPRLKQNVCSRHQSPNSPSQRQKSNLLLPNFYYMIGTNLGNKKMSDVSDYYVVLEGILLQTLNTKKLAVSKSLQTP